MYVIQQFALYLLLSIPLVGAYLMFGVGAVVVFRASKVLNLALGAMAVLPAYLVYSMVKAGLPTLVALPLGVAAGALLGVVVERLFIRPLARQGPTAQTVGTVAVFGLVVALVAQIYGSGSMQAPQIFPSGGITVAGALLRWGQIGTFAVGLICLAGCLALLKYTRIGLAMRGAAENPTAAALMGVNPLRMARLAWALGGGLAGLAGILLAAVTSLNPYSLSLQMLPGFVAALIGGLGSVVGALIGAFVVGGVEGLVPAFALIPGLRSISGQVGIPQLVLTIVALVVMFTRGKRFSQAGESGPLGRVEQAAPVHSAFDPERLPRRGGRKRLGRFVLLAALLAWPFAGIPGWFPIDRFSLLGDANQAGEYFLVAASLVLLTGWVGQISLAQAAFVGIGAFGTATVASHVSLPFPTGLLVGAALGGGTAALLGLVALRVRGLYLAVGTLIFAWMCDSYLFVVPWFTSHSSFNAPKVGKAGTFPFFDFTDRRTFYFVILAVSSLVAFGLLNLRDSKTGRAFTAIRGSETAAAAFGIDVRRTKLLAFILAGGIAGLAGNLIITNQNVVVPDSFNLQTSLLFLAIAVVGGLRSLGGAVSASVVFAGLDELFFRVPSLGRYLQLVSAVLLAVVLLVYPGGLAAIPVSVRNLPHRMQRLRSELDVVGRRLGAALAALDDRLPAHITERSARLVGAVAERAAALGRLLPAPVSSRSARPLRRFTPLVATVESLAAAAAAAPADVSTNGHKAEDTTAEPAALRPLAADRAADHALPAGPPLSASNITVQFGGLTAVDNVSLEVGKGQIVGLMGPNGAGKTTLFNAVSGLNSPTSGRVRLYGEDVTKLPPHQRAARGLARTFQVIQLFPELTVFDNLMIATHVHNPTGPWSHITLTAGAVGAESAAEETCRRVISYLGLEDIADRGAAGLPFGTLRLVEFARAMVTGAPLVMLDEPASGLDDTETARFADVLRRVRDELELSILLIEHDVHMVTSVSDYIYVIDRGKPIADGTPAAIRANANVQAAYLGKPTEDVVPPPRKTERSRQSRTVAGAVR